MTGIDCNRRKLLIGLGASASALICGPAAAQQRKLFGIKLPKEIADVLPSQILGFAETADAIIALEREADIKQLPKSLLQFDDGAAVSPSDISFYALVLPRLVALIDRGELRNTEFADKAGGLLAQLHAGQHEVPEGWRGFGPAQDFGVAGLGGAGLGGAGLGGAGLGEAGLGGADFGGAGQRPFSLDPQQETGLPPVLETAPVATQPIDITIPPEPEPETKPEPQPLPEPQPEQDQPMSRRRDFASLSAEYGRMFASINVRPERARTADWHLTMLRNARPRYQFVGDSTGVPWYFIGIIHGLEASFNFRAHLHNGDFPLSTRTRQVPAGRPRVWLPPADWGSSARDALALLGFTGQRDWSLERTLYRLEMYNGLGYRSYGVPTPYLWSFSNHYKKGKFVADGKWNAAAKSQQCGAAVMMKMLSDAGDIKLV